MKVTVAEPCLPAVTIELTGKEALMLRRFVGNVGGSVDDEMSRLSYSPSMGTKGIRKVLFTPLFDALDGAGID